MHGDHTKVLEIEEKARQLQCGSILINIYMYYICSWVKGSNYEKKVVRMYNIYKWKSHAWSEQLPLSKLVTRQWNEKLIWRDIMLWLIVKQHVTIYSKIIRTSVNKRSCMRFWPCFFASWRRVLSKKNEGTKFIHQWVGAD